MTQLFNGWIDGSVEPEDGCEAKVVIHLPHKSLPDLAIHTSGLFFYLKNVNGWQEINNGRRYPRQDTIRYFPIPPHDKIMTIGSTVLEAGDE